MFLSSDCRGKPESRNDEMNQFMRLRRFLHYNGTFGRSSSPFLLEEWRMAWNYLEDHPT
jgi:hypothetical protein